VEAMKEYQAYSKEVMKHFLHPKHSGKLKDPSGVGNAGNLICGDVMQVFIKVKENKKTGKRIISDVKFQTFGCVVAIANSSMIATMATGKTLEEALKIKKDDVLKKLGRVPPIKIHCSVLAVDALDEAIYDYMVKNDLKIPEELKKTHERIKKGLQDIEHRHREYFKLEKEIYRKK
jgi:nitrogen fixation NifU-like protein